MNENGLPDVATDGSGAAVSPSGDRGSLIWGALLVGVGVIWLLKQLDLVGRLGAALVVGAILGGLAALCLRLYSGDREHRWGLLIPAGFFASVATVAVGELIGLLPRPFVPLVFVAGPAAGFYAIYKRRPSRGWALVCAWLAAVVGIAGFVGSLGSLGGLLGWPAFFWGVAAACAWHFLQSGKEWILLPAGISTSFGVGAFLDALNASFRLQWSVFLVGLGATLAVYYLFGRPGQVKWAAAPAVILAVLGVLGIVAGPLVTFGIPIAFVAFGLYLLLFYGKDEGTTGAPPGSSSSGGDPPPPPA